MTSLSLPARRKIKEAGLTPSEYARKIFHDGGWYGDTCGCPDDRCQGYHHEEGAECPCLASMLARYGH